MAYGKQYGKDERPKKPKKVGTLWKADKAKDPESVVLTGYLDLGLDAQLKVRVEKAGPKKSERSPDYILTVMVNDWQQSGGTSAPAEDAKGADEEIPF